MIAFKNEGSQVVATVVGQHPISSVSFALTRDAGQPWVASLLADNFRSTAFGLLQKIRSEAYEQGWNDHKKRNKRCEWFSGNF